MHTIMFVYVDRAPIVYALHPLTYTQKHYRKNMSGDASPHWNIVNERKQQIE